MTLPALWFCLVAFMLAMYFVLDGFDLGAGAVALRVARTPDERRMILRAIGPVWDGNEVWLIAGGATLYFAFPRLYASAFSGFYLPLMIVLWLLMLRGLAIEFRGHVTAPLWIAGWDVVFSLASGTLALFFGVAMGNVLRGVPLDADGWFFLPLWTNLGLPGLFGASERPGIFDWYTLSVGLSALATLAMHGALWIALKTTGDLERRALEMAARLWFAVLASMALAVALTLYVQPIIRDRLLSHGWSFTLPAIGLAMVWMYLRRGRTGPAFLASSGFIAGMIFLAVFGLYPTVLPSVSGVERSLTLANSAARESGLRNSLVWWLPGMALVCAYLGFIYRKFAGKVTLAEAGY